MKNIVLMGIKHCGKTTLGKKLSEELKIDFKDLDQLMIKKYTPDKNISIREIFILLGNNGFKELEKKCLENLSEDFKKNKNIIILALGGNTIENKKAIELLKDNCFFIFLDQDKDVLYGRIIKEGLPPFLSDKDPYNDFSKIYETRKKLYLHNADLSVDLRNKNIEESAELILNKLRGAGYAW